MIKLECEEYCESCKYFEPVKEAKRLENSDISTIIFCKDRDKCSRMYSVLERRMRDDRSKAERDESERCS